MQSEEYLIAEAVPQMTHEVEQTTGFTDAKAGVSVGTPSRSIDLDMVDAVTGAGLTEYLSRPVRIASFTWAQADARGVFQTMTPWQLFFNNASIKNKLNNFAFLRANLHLKFVVNASPFYYGSMRACYQPLHVFKPSTIVGGSTPASSNPELIPYSQQPGVWLKPQQSEGAELILPFFYPKSFVNITKASNLSQMGQLNMVIYNVLRSANGATGTGVSVQVYAWATDVTLAGPTVGLALQADEYGMGAVSGPATTLASIASKLRSVPVIGKFATATEIGAKAVAGIAQLFGFTNVPVIEDTKPMRPTPFPQLASAEISYPVEKLTLDPKNELSIDPTIVGMSSDDELSIQHFASRQSFLCNLSWSTSTPVDTPLFTTKVTPNLGIGDTTTNGRNYFTPLALLATLFRSWRGDIVFTFRFVASPFHKGRVRISYDPVEDDVQTTGDTGPTVYNRIVDLGAETEVEVRVPYQQALAWCYCYESLGVAWQNSTTPTLAYTETYDNGILSMKVLTQLSAPVVTSSVDVQVFVRAADNIEFSNPATMYPFYTAFALQSDEYSEKREGEELEIGQVEQSIDVLRGRVNFGENVRSLRTLMRRTNYLDTIQAVNPVAYGVYKITQTRYPAYYGFDTHGLNIAVSQIATGNKLFNYTNMTPWHMVSNCFIGQKGSMFWHFNGHRGTLTTPVRVSRDTSTFTIYDAKFDGTVYPTSPARAAYQNLIRQTPAAGGSALAHNITSAGISVAVPNMTVFKFQTTDPARVTDPASTFDPQYDGSLYEGFEVEYPQDQQNNDLTSMRVDRYFSIGTDYTLHFFLNCPVLRSLAVANVVAP